MSHQSCKEVVFLTKQFELHYTREKGLSLVSKLYFKIRVLVLKLAIGYIFIMKFYVLYLYWEKKIIFFIYLFLMAVMTELVSNWNSLTGCTKQLCGWAYLLHTGHCSLLELVWCWAVLKHTSRIHVEEWVLWLRKKLFSRFDVKPLCHFKA